MSKIVKVSQNNYRLQVQSGGTITFDTGTSTGTVVITGNLDVKGTTTTVESTNTTVKDNILQLNYGQTGNGISSTLNYQAGIQIGRGNYSDAKLVFDETVDHYDQNSDSNLPGTFSFQFADGSLAGIQTSGIAAGLANNLNLDLQNSSNVVKIVNADALSYSARVTAGDGNVIPNKQFVYDYIQSGVIVPGQADVDRIYKAHGTSPKIIDTEIIANTSSLQFLVNPGTGLAQRAIITASGFSADDINLFGHTITSTGTYNLVLTALSTNEVEVNSVLDLVDQGGSVVATGGKTKLYSKTLAGPGKTGLFIANNNTSDELVSKNRAVLLSILL
jgi:hypothetical protein